MGPVEEATKRDLAFFPTELSESSLAESALALARELDSDSSATSKSMCARAHLEILDRLRELAPPKERAKNGIDELKEQRARRRAGSTAT